MIALRLGLAGASSALGWIGADQVTAQGPDLAGIALLITAVSGLIATIGGLFLATRKKPMDPQDVALLALAERLSRDEEPDEPA